MQNLGEQNEVKIFKPQLLDTGVKITAGGNVDVYIIKSPLHFRVSPARCVLWSSQSSRQRQE
jgi:hypothetical protein